MTLRIETTSDGATTTIRLTGRIESTYLHALWADVRAHRPPVEIDLDEVSLVDAGVAGSSSSVKPEGSPWSTARRTSARGWLRCDVTNSRPAEAGTRLNGTDRVTRKLRSCRGDENLERQEHRQPRRTHPEPARRRRVERRHDLRACTPPSAQRRAATSTPCRRESHLPRAARSSRCPRSRVRSSFCAPGSRPPSEPRSCSARFSVASTRRSLAHSERRKRPAVRSCTVREGAFDGAPWGACPVTPSRRTRSPGSSHRSAPATPRPCWRCSPTRDAGSTARRPPRRGQHGRAASLSDLQRLACFPLAEVTFDRLHVAKPLQRRAARGATHRSTRASESARRHPRGEAGRVAGWFGLGGEVVRRRARVHRRHVTPPERDESFGFLARPVQITIPTKMTHRASAKMEPASKEKSMYPVPWQAAAMRPLGDDRPARSVRAARAHLLGVAAQRGQGLWTGGAVVGADARPARSAWRRAGSRRRSGAEERESEAPSRHDPGLLRPVLR